jgi:hypothetical protein
VQPESVTPPPTAARHDPRADGVQAALPAGRARRLRLINVVLAVLHAGQAAVLLVLSTDFSLTVVETFPEGPPGTATPAPEAWLDIALGPAVAVFLLLAAIDHAVVALPGVHSRYEGVLRRGRNPFRWTEYSLSATLMVLLIALISGITDVTALVGIAGANIAMILFGLRMERVNDQAHGRVDWEPFAFGCVVGLLPWVAIVLSVGGAALDAPAGQGPPGFVWAIIVSLFLLFFSFAVVQFLQYRRIGRFRDYVVGEYAYLLLSLVAKSALAWQVFANVLVGS